MLRKALQVLRQTSEWGPIDGIVLPAGYFCIDRFVGDLAPDERLRRVGKEPVVRATIACCALLKSSSPGALLFAGIDAWSRNGRVCADQLCVVCDGKGLVGLVRKIFPSALDITKNYVPAAADYGAAERVVELAGGTRAVACVCYDMFGIAEDPEIPSIRSLAIEKLLLPGGKLRRRDPQFKAVRRRCVGEWRRGLRKQKPDFAIALVHEFERPGRENYWQRHGIATASAVLGGFAVGAAHFAKRLPERHQAPLAAYRVPARHLAEGNQRRAWRYPPIDDRPVTVAGRIAAVLRLYRFEA